MRTLPYFLTATALCMFHQNIVAETTSADFQVTANITTGCSLGGGSSDVSTFGSINFGNSIASLAQDIDAVSSGSSGGSIVIQCNPGTNITIAIDNGLHATGSITTGRQLKNSATNESLNYQLYQDTSRSTVWGNNSNGGTALSYNATGAVDQIPIYARLFSSTVMPTAGTYTDTVTVTVTY